MAKQARLLVPGFLFVGLLLSACLAPVCNSREPTIISGELARLVDKSLLTGEPCAPPCWYGITPGITSDTEAVEILTKLEFVNPDSVDLKRSKSGEGTIAWRTIFTENESNMIGVFSDQHGIVYRIDIDELWYQVTLQELIDTLGEPSGIMTHRIRFPDGWSDCMTVHIVWFDKGLEVTVGSISLTEEAVSHIGPNLHVSEVTYFPSTSSLEGYTAMQTDPYSPENRFAEWDGFK